MIIAEWGTARIEMEEEEEGAMLVKGVMLLGSEEKTNK